MKFHTFHPHVEFIKTNQATGAIFQTQSYFNPSFIFISMADLIYSMSPYLAKNNSTFPRLLSHQIHICFTSEKNLRSSLPNDIPNIELESNVIFKQKSLVQTCYYSPLSNTKNFRRLIHHGGHIGNATRWKHFLFTLATARTESIILVPSGKTDLHSFKTHDNLFCTTSIGLSTDRFVAKCR